MFCEEGEKPPNKGVDATPGEGEYRTKIPGEASGHSITVREFRRFTWPSFLVTCGTEDPTSRSGNLPPDCCELSARQQVKPRMTSSSSFAKDAESTSSNMASTFRSMSKERRTI